MNPTSSTRAQIEGQVRAVFNAFAYTDERHQRDLDALLALCDERIVYDMPFLDPPLSITGKASFRALLERSQGMFCNISYTLHAIHIDEAEGCATVETRSSRTLVSNGLPFTARYVFLLALKNGLLIQFREYVQSNDANSVLHALGLQRQRA